MRGTRAAACRTPQSRLLPISDATAPTMNHGMEEQPCVLELALNSAHTACACCSACCSYGAVQQPCLCAMPKEGISSVRCQHGCSGTCPTKHANIRVMLKLREHRPCRGNASFELQTLTDSVRRLVRELFACAIHLQASASIGTYRARDLGWLTRHLHMEP